MSHGLAGSSWRDVSRDQRAALHEEEPAMADDCEITPRPNGPYLVKGAVRITDADGTEYDTTGRAVVALCRCGGSTTKPFCDGTHSRIGFAAAERAVQQAEH
jgi:CDGSH-type Zn-finger protein